MTGMEHAIEQATERAELVLAPHFRNVALGGVEDDTHLGALVLRAVDALADAGLIAPAPLREEWAARYVNGGGAVCQTRYEAEAALDRMTRDSHRHRVDEPPAPEIAGIYARYVSDWLPVDRAEGDGRADQ